MPYKDLEKRREWDRTKRNKVRTNQLQREKYWKDREPVRRGCLHDQSEPGDEVGSVKLSVVCRGDENKNWSHYTPSGQITMSTLNPKAFAWFKENLGKEVYVDFTLAEGVTEVTNEDGSMVSRTLPDAKG